MTNFRIQVGNIADIKADAIVNAANEQLAAGSGVCGAIFAKAGPELAEEIAKNHEYGCPTGDAVTTPAFLMDATYIIHAVAPIFYAPISDIYNELKSAYVAIFREASDWGAKSLAIPSLGTGVYGWDLTEATAIAKAGILEGLREHPLIDEVIFSCFNDEAATTYQDMFEVELLYGLDFRLKCPKCGKAALPISYGMPTPEALNDPNFYAGGCLMEPGQPNWACRDCEIEFA